MSAAISEEKLTQLGYYELFLLDLLNDGEIATYLNNNGFANKTVCPECHVDDFTHVEGCSQNKWLYIVNPNED